MYGSDALLQMLHFMAAVGLNEMLVDVAMVILADPIRLVSFSVAVWTLALPLPIWQWTESQIRHQRSD